MRKYRLNFKTIKRNVVILIATLLLIGAVKGTASFFRCPEKFLPTWRYQLQLDIERGDKEACAYYQQLVDKGIDPLK